MLYGVLSSSLWRAACVLLCIWVGSAALAQPGPAAAARPMLRIDPGVHTAMVRGAVYDATRNRVYTASDDKTVRVWQLPGGQLLNTWRVPMLEGAEGQLFALALSPDGRWLAAGGWTGWDWEQRSSIYLFDTATQQLVQRWPVATSTVTSLRFSPDGEKIAVGLHGDGGLVVLRRDTGRVVATDRAYQGMVLDMGFDRYGRLFTVGLDGFIRIYTQDHALLARRAATAAQDPVTVRVSPDGERVAIGFGDAAVVEVVGARDLSTQAVLKVGDRRQRDFVALGWSDDARFLYAGGAREGDQSGVFRWRMDGAQPVGDLARPWAVLQGLVNDLLALNAGRMLYVSGAPAWGWMDPSGGVQEIMKPAQWRFAGPDTRLRVSPTGGEVAITVAGRSMSFSVSEARLEWRAPVRRPALRNALVAAKGWRIEVTPDRRALRLQGAAVALETYEKVHSHALSPTHDQVVIGTEWALRVYDAQGHLRWLNRVSSPVRAVNASADGRVVVAALGDGTLRWFSARTGEELLALFVHRNAQDWIAWTPGGQYASSPYGDRLIGWHVNRGLDQEPDFFQAVQLERVLYRPDIVRQALGDTPQPTGPGLSANDEMTADRLQKMAPPRVRLRLQGVDERRSVARLQLEAERIGPQMRDLALFVNGIPVTSSKDRGVGLWESARIRREFEVPLDARFNDIRVEAFTDVSMGLARLQVEMPVPAEPAQQAGNLYLLAIGASQFDQLPPSTWLSYAARDADVFGDTLQQLTGAPFAQRFVKVLSDNADLKPTRRNVLDALEFLKGAQAQDTVVLFLASHGLSDAQGNYYFVPRDAKAADIQGAQAAENPGSLLSWQVFFDVLRVVAGRRVLVVDTCQARGIEGRFDPHALIKRSASSQFALMLASGPDEESQEYDPAGHGLFTYGLLSSLKGAQSRGSGGLNLQDWFAGSARVVQQYRDRSIGPQTPQFLAPTALQTTRVWGLAVAPANDALNRPSSR